MSKNIWRLVGEAFDEKLPRRAAVLVKEDDWGLAFAYPCEFGKIGWLIDSRLETTYDERPIAALTFGERSYPDLTGKRGCKNTFYFETMESMPSLVRRNIVFTNMGLAAKETFAQNPPGGFYWELELECKMHGPHPFEQKMYLLLSLAGKASLVVDDRRKILHAKMKENELFLCCPFDNYGIYNSTDAYTRDMEKGDLDGKIQKGRYAAFEFNIRLKPGERKILRFGVSTKSDDSAYRAAGARNIQMRLEKIWNKWFSSLPELKFDSEREAKAYYKCWRVIRSNYYKHPKLGKTVLEALPVYRGYWQWAFPAIEWHSSMNPEIGHDFVKKLFDFFFLYQRSDGYVTHAIYINEKIPGDSWSKKNLIQTPHFPWVALRYYHATKDIESLRKWYPALAHYYDYINSTRDDNFLKLHLWAILASFDTGLDTTAPFEMVTYGKNGIKEEFCYPAIFAAERCRFEESMGKIAEIIKINDGRDWFRESGITKNQMDKILWDNQKKWYGVLRADGKIETCIGVDGLFPLAYGIVSGSKAREVKKNFKKLICKYGAHTVAPGEAGYEPDTYWRGPVWAKPCSLAMASAFHYYPDLMETIKTGLLEFLLRHPSVWECMNGETGDIARGDRGVFATPMISSNVGAGEAIGALRIAHGDNVFSF
ncbi:hypothetical protein JW926_03025 [Candidatus Sumerlaeota bacterium]|nr:hypothetical protein [Candidatus Sumerlaeota bacterium]